MKKLILVLIIGLAFGTAAFADHPDTLGIGGVTGAGFGNYGEFEVNFYPGLSLKAPGIPIFWGLYGRVNSNSMGLGVTGDYYIFEWNLVDNDATNDDGTYHVKIDWYLGLGFFGNFDFWDAKNSDGNDELHMGISAGLRVPFGVSWHALSNLEVALGIAPGVGIYSADKLRFHYVIPTEVAVRYWFGQ